MGMFDSLIVKCPDCGEEVEFQSKAGECMLACYSLDDCPPGILGDLDNVSEKCQCGKFVTLKVQIRATVE